MGASLDEILIKEAEGHIAAMESPMKDDSRDLFATQKYLLSGATAAWTVATGLYAS